VNKSNLDDFINGNQRFYLKSRAAILPYALIAIAIARPVQTIDTGGWASFDA